MLEKDLEEKCRLSAIKRGYKLIPLRSPGNKGIHDRLLLMPGHVIFTEFKRGKGAEVQPLQDYWQKYLTGMFIPAYRVWSLTHFNNIMDLHKRCGGMR